MKAMLYSLLILYQLATYCNTVCDVTGNESGDYTNLMSSLLIFFCLQLLEDHYIAAIRANEAEIATTTVNPGYNTQIYSQINLQ